MSDRIDPNPVIDSILAIDLDDTHLGKHIGFYADGKRHFGVLEAIRRPGPGIWAVTLSPGRFSHHDLPAATEIDVITQESAALQLAAEAIAQETQR